MRVPQPLNPTPMAAVALPRAPLARVLVQVRFPPVLAIRDPDKVAVVQEALRDTYPHLSKEWVYSVESASDQVPSVSRQPVWRFADEEFGARWRMSLGMDFVALDTSSYESRTGFLGRLGAVVAAVEDTFYPPSTHRIGLRYIDRLTGPAVERIDELIHPAVLGTARLPGAPSCAALRESVIHQLTEAQFLAQDGARVHARWGEMPAKVTYDPDAIETVAEPSWILDLDTFTNESKLFDAESVLDVATEFAKCQYWVFRQLVTDEFLRVYGGKP